MCHFPPGTSKWNKIEHRLISYMSQTGGAGRWSVTSIVELIAATKTQTGLGVQAN